MRHANHAGAKQHGTTSKIYEQFLRSVEVFSRGSTTVVFIPPVGPKWKWVEFPFEFLKITFQNYRKITFFVFVIHTIFILFRITFVPAARICMTCIYIHTVTVKY